jgi:hypothetical protein
VELPAHLRTLAGVGVEVTVNVEAQVGALGARRARGAHVLRGTIRDYGTEQRRPFLRFFACEQVGPTSGRTRALPDAVVSGARFMVVGAISGGEQVEYRG